MSAAAIGFLIGFVVGGVSCSVFTFLAVRAPLPDPCDRRRGDRRRNPQAGGWISGSRWGDAQDPAAGIKWPRPKEDGFGSIGSARGAPRRPRPRPVSGKRDA